MKNKNLANKIKSWIVPLLAAVIVSFTIGCPFRRFFGIPCPGCGMTRAHLAAVHLNFASALYYHPLFWTVIPLALWYGVFKKTPFKFKDGILLGVVGAAFLAVYIIRIFFLHTEFLQINIQSSVIYQILNWLGGLKHG